METVDGGKEIGRVEVDSLERYASKRQWYAEQVWS